jgi:thiol-disulfide isomerase/thioredoxin
MPMKKDKRRLAEMENIQSVDHFWELTKGKNALFVFSADWCPDCGFIKPHLPELEKENPQLAFYYVDRDEYIDLCAELNVFGIPSFIAFNEGKEIGRFVSKDRKTKEEVQQFLDGLNL